MKVQEVMTQDVKFCEPETNLAAVTALLWQADCGAVPVVDRGKLLGMITDRDVCIALGTKNVLASDLSAADVISHEVFTCAPQDDIHKALKTMRTHQVRRLPVVDHQGLLAGILSLNEIVLRSHKLSRRVGDLAYEDVVTTMKAICEHRHPEHHELASETLVDAVAQ
jgi:CBS domain-containing protein